MSGRLRFGNINLYRLLEATLADTFIGDRAEGRAETLLDTATVQDEAIRRKMLSDLRISADQGVEVQISESFSRSFAPGFVLSLSQGDLPALRRVFCNGNDRANYDACVRVDDVHGLAREIFEHGQLDDGRHVLDLFGTYEARSVTYSASASAQYDGEFSSPSLFEKKARYSAQHEFRVALIPTQNIPDDALFVTLPRARAFLHLEFREPRERCEATRAADDDRIKLLRRIRDALESYDRDLAARRERTTLTAAFDEANEEFRARHLRALGEAYWALRQEFGLREEPLDDWFAFERRNLDVLRRRFQTLLARAGG